MHLNQRINAGFSLIEVMVAVIVLSVGLLGVAKMQALSLSSTTISSKRSLAAVEAASLAAAMHVNRGYWNGADAAAAKISILGTTASVTSGAPVLNGLLGGVAPNCASNVTPCTVATMAAYDIINWASDLQKLLPNNRATIACGAAPVTCTVTITWAESVVAINSNLAAGGQATATQDPTYTLYVQP